MQDKGQLFELRDKGNKKFLADYCFENDNF